MKLQFLFVVFAALGRLGLSVETTPTVGIARHDGPEGKLKPKHKPMPEVMDHESSEPGKPGPKDKPSPNLRASSFGYGYDAGYGGGYNGRFGGRLRNFYNNNFGGGDDDGSDDHGRRKLEEEGDEGLSGYPFPFYDGPDGPFDGYDGPDGPFDGSFDGSFDNYSPEDMFSGFITFFDRLGRRFSRAVIYDSRYGAWLDNGPIFGGADQLPTTDGPTDGNDPRGPTKSDKADKPKPDKPKPDMTDPSGEQQPPMSERSLRSYRRRFNNNYRYNNNNNNNNRHRRYNSGYGYSYGYGGGY